MLNVDDAGVGRIRGFRPGIGALAAAKAKLGEGAHVYHQRGRMGRSPLESVSRAKTSGGTTRCWPDWLGNLPGMRKLDDRLGRSNQRKSPATSLDPRPSGAALPPPTRDRG
jgi:hypothetical protein